MLRSRHHHWFVLVSLRKYSASKCNSFSLTEIGSYSFPPCGLGPLPWRPCLGWGSGAPPFCFLFFPLFSRRS